MSIKDNIKIVEGKIDKACNEVGRDRNEVKLIAVSKTKPVSMIEEAYMQGCRDFGENKVQEIMDKYPVLPKDINWHMIGHLQTNKVKYIVDKVCLIHSVDSVKLAKEISKEAVKKNVCVNILLEVNVGNEDTKYGFKMHEVMEAFKEIKLLPSIKIKGLMTVAPITNDASKNAPIFRNLKKLLVDINNQTTDNNYMEMLSMGMTGDYIEAVKEGATLVRVGTGIFGERDYGNRV